MLTAVKHRVFFVPEVVSEKKEVADLTQMNLAAAIPKKAFNKDIVGVVWATKWAVNGLVPVRPTLTTLTPFELAPGHAVQIGSVS